MWIDILEKTFIFVNFVYIFSFILFGIYIRKLVKNSEAEAGEMKTELPVSVLIPVRNEEAHIKKLIKMIENQSYPKHLIEVIFIDDESTDQTANRIQYFASLSSIEVKYLYSEREKYKSPKKMAITKGVEQAKNELILLLDADVEFGENWLASMVMAWSKGQYDFLAGLVMLNYWEHETYLKRIQALDFAGLISIGLALFALKKPFLCNAANLCFKKSAFLEIGGYTGYENLISGDDVFLLEKMKMNRKHIGYNLFPDSVVVSYPREKLKDFLLQRARWGSKNFNFKDLKFILFQFPFYLYFPLFFLMLLIKGPASVMHWFLAKSLVDAFLVKPLLDRYDKDRFLLRSLFTTEVFQFFYMPLVGILILLKKMDWK